MRALFIPLLLVATIATAISAAYAKHQSRKLFIELQGLHLQVPDVRAGPAPHTLGLSHRGEAWEEGQDENPSGAPFGSHHSPPTRRCGRA